MRSSLSRTSSIIRKEFLNILRAPTALATLIFLPLLQILLCGYAINANPKNIPTAVIDQDKSYFSRKLIRAMENTEYFDIKVHNPTQEDAKRMMESGDVLFILHINSDFTENLIRNTPTQVLLEADFTNYVAVNSAISAFNELVPRLYDREFTGGLNYLQQNPSPIQLQIHRLYNPAIESVYSVVPGLIGVILLMSLAITISVNVTKEFESGTYETLINSPLNKFELLVGKMLPMIVIGYIELTSILVFSKLLFDLPMQGSLVALYLASFVFILSCLSYGFVCAMLAKTDILAAQLVVFLYLPSILLSGFIYPFEGMPKFAQAIGALLPLTYYIRICRGILIKGYSWEMMLNDLWPILLFLLLMLFLIKYVYKNTLD